MADVLNPVWKDEQIEIGVTATSANPPVWTYAKLCKGIKGIQLNINENVVTEQYLCGEGHAHNEVTGMAPQIQITGDRVEGDTAQDYIAGLLPSFSFSFSCSQFSDTCPAVSAFTSPNTCGWRKISLSHRRSHTSFMSKSPVSLAIFA